jgi:hypothetical protein
MVLVTHLKCALRIFPSQPDTPLLRQRTVAPCSEQPKHVREWIGNLGICPFFLDKSASRSIERTEMREKQKRTLTMLLATPRRLRAWNILCKARCTGLSYGIRARLRDRRRCLIRREARRGLSFSRLVRTVSRAPCRRSARLNVSYGVCHSEDHAPHARQVC